MIPRGLLIRCVSFGATAAALMLAAGPASAQVGAPAQRPKGRLSVCTRLTDGGN